MCRLMCRRPYLIIERHLLMKKETTLPMPFGKLLIVMFKIGYIQMVMSMQGKPLLCVDGYTFYKKSTATISQKTRWLCSTHHPKGCRAVIYTYEGKIIKQNNVHSHDIVMPQIG
ncbi:hypothetical protein ABMA27_001366 [Loxostege sticticalis]|uniref:FLYWCH-type domain-containing protein n=1 Tax=Loxostege sticticalis TaxID=481309 RepID=A0ABR3HY73_LOXSC